MNVLPLGGVSPLCRKDAHPVRGVFPARFLDAPARKGGVTARKGGAPARKGGAPARKGGAPTRKGGAPARKGGAPTRKGGAPARKGGAPARKGGAPTRKGGAPTRKGGATARKGGATAPKGGATARKGGGHSTGKEAPATSGEAPPTGKGALPGVDSLLRKANRAVPTENSARRHSSAIAQRHRCVSANLAMRHGTSGSSLAFSVSRLASRRRVFQKAGVKNEPPAKRPRCRRQPQQRTPARNPANHADVGNQREILALKKPARYAANLHS